MVKPTILEEESITMSEVKKHLEKVEKEEGELNFRAQKTKEYLQDFKPVSSKEAADISKKLLGLDLSRLKHDQIVKIIDFMPKTEDDLAVLLQGFSITIPKTSLKQVLSALDDVRPL